MTSLIFNKLTWISLFSLSFTLFMPVFFPHLSLLYFAPLLVICFYHYSFETCLWIALWCGLVLDLLSSGSHLGLYALNFILTVALLYAQKRHFFSDRLSTLPIMTFFFSDLFSLFQLLLFYVFEKGVGISGEFLFRELILVPFWNASFAFFVFELPFWLFGKKQRKAQDYFISN